jgi:DNA-binding response OmpR family regulator
LANWRYDQVRAVLAVADGGLRAAIRDALAQRGLRQFKTAETVDDLQSRLAGGEVDLLVTTLDLAGNDTGRLLQRMRHDEVGQNPFSVVVTLLDHPDPRLARRAVDDLLLVPFPPKQLVERLNTFVIGRRPFVITHDYVGPERPFQEGENRLALPRLEVPNPVRWQVVANTGGASLTEQIREASHRINLHKVKSYGAQICFLAERIAGLFAETGSQADILPDVENLAAMGDDLLRRMAATTFAEARELNRALQALCERIRRNGRAPRAEEVGILPVLARTIRRVLDEDPEAVSWADTALQLRDIFPGA